MTNALYPDHVIMPAAIWYKAQQTADFYERELVAARQHIAHLEAQVQVLSKGVIDAQVPTVTETTGVA